MPRWLFHGSTSAHRACSAQGQAAGKPKQKKKSKSSVGQGQLKHGEVVVDPLAPLKWPFKDPTWVAVSCAAPVLLATVC